MKKLLAIVVLGLLLSSNAYAATIADELTKLNNLYKEGAITKEEFSKAKDILFKASSVEEKTENKKSKAKKKQKVKKLEKKEKTKVKVEAKKSKVKKVARKRTFEEDLSKNYVNLEDVNALGAFKKIEKVPDGMFKKTHKTFKARANKSMQDMYRVFVQNKGLMEKYPENMMRAMGYFEFFYMDQLDKKKKALASFKSNYPNVKNHHKKEVKSLYSLNQARKSMREAMGLTLEDDPETALESYMTMYNFLAQGEKKNNQLTSSEKKLKKESANFKKHYGSFKKTVNLKSEKRIDQKTFDKDLKKNIKDVRKALNKLSNINSKSDKVYQSISEMFEKSLKTLEKCGTNCERKDLLTVIDSIEFNTAVLADVEKDIIKKRFTQDMSKADMKILSDNQKKILAYVSANMKQQKSIKRKNLQNSVLNLGNNDYPVEEILDKIEGQGFEIKSVSMSFENVDSMKRWVMKDWANSWRGEIPTELKDNAGNKIEFTKENIEDVKAQLAINTFGDMIDSSALEIKDSMNENVKEITEAIESAGGFDLDSWLNEDFSITLDNYSALVGNAYGIDMKDFNDMTKFVNEIYGTNVSSESYAETWANATMDTGSSWLDVTKGVDLIDQVGSFEAASIAAELGTDLQTVADSIAQAATAGVSTDLEEAAKGLGYSSFADAVAAYNAQYGTNYTPEEAAAALGN